jgi:hypothetical protein
MTTVQLNLSGQRYRLSAPVVCQVRYRRVAPGGPYALTALGGFHRELGDYQPEVPAAADVPAEGFAFIYMDLSRETKLWAVGVPPIVKAEVGWGGIVALFSG